MNERHAIIDIGSNSVRLVIYGGPLRAPVVLLNEKVTARLGKGFAETGRLSEKAMKTALAALSRYAVLLEVMDVTDVETVATAAARDAGNGADFLRAVAGLGLKPRLLSGEEEACASAMGVAAAFPGAAGLTADLGGGSLELTSIAADTCGKGVTLPYGTLRLAEMRAAGSVKFAAKVHRDLRASGWSAEAGQPFYVVGGSWRALARYAMQRIGWPLDDPHGMELQPQAAIKLCQSFARSKPVPTPGISASRLTSLPDAAALLAVLLRELQPSRLIFSSWGLREGLLYAKLPAATRMQDPLLAGVSTFAYGFDVTASIATMVAGWTAEASSEKSAASDERLRLAATMLAIASMRIEPNLRAEQATDWALRKRWVGIDARGRAMIAMALLANAGRPVIPDELALLAPQTDLAEATAWGLAIRLCRRFGGCLPRALNDAALVREDGRLALAIREPLHRLANEAVEKDLRNLAAALALEPELRLVKAEAAITA